MKIVNMETTDTFDSSMGFLHDSYESGSPLKYGKYGMDLIMKGDTRVTDNSREMDLKIPGFDKDEIYTRVENGYVTVSAKKEDAKGEKYSCPKHYAGSVSRSFYVGEDVTEKDVTSTFVNGTLTLSIAC